MDNAPEQPGGKAADLDPAEIGHRAATPDGGQVARVEVAKRLHRAPPRQYSADNFGHIGALLLGSRRHPGHGSAVLAQDQGRVADDEDLRSARQREIGIYLHAAGTIFLRAQPLPRR